MGIRQNLLDDAVAALPAGIHEPKAWNPWGQPFQTAASVTLLLRDKRTGVGDHEAEITQAGLIESRVVDLVQDAVAEREPDAARGSEGCADAALSAGRPPRRNAGPARGVPGNGLSP